MLSWCSRPEPEQYLTSHNIAPIRTCKHGAVQQPDIAPIGASRIRRHAVVGADLMFQGTHCKHEAGVSKWIHSFAYMTSKTNCELQSATLHGAGGNDRCIFLGWGMGGGAPGGVAVCSWRAYWPLTTYPCPFLEPFPSVGGGAHPLVPAPPILTSLPTPVLVSLLCVGSTQRRALALAVGHVRPSGHPALHPPLGACVSISLWGVGTSRAGGGVANLMQTWISGILQGKSTGHQHSNRGYFGRGFYTFSMLSSDGGLTFKSLDLIGRCHLHCRF